jgi:hypothetical protein
MQDAASGLRRTTQEGLGTTQGRTLGRAVTRPYGATGRRLRALVIVGGEPYPTFIFQRTGLEIWCSVPGPSTSRRSVPTGSAVGLRRRPSCRPLRHLPSSRLRSCSSRPPRRASGSSRRPLVEGEHGVEEVHVGVHGHLREFPSSLLREPLLAGQLSRHLPGIYLLGRYGARRSPYTLPSGLGELLGRPVYPLLLLSVQSALSPVLRALTSRGYLLGGRPAPSRKPPRSRPPACGLSPR